MTPTTFIGLLPSYSATNEWCAAATIGSMARIAPTVINVLLIPEPPRNYESACHGFASDAESKVADAERRTKVVITIGRPEKVFRMRPSTAAHDRQRDTRSTSSRRCETRIRWCPRRIIDRRSGVVSGLVRVGNPFPHVAKHVIEPPAIWFLAAYGMGLIV